MIRHLVSLLLVCGVSSNLWDNVYSQTLADTPMIVSESLNFDFKIKQYSIVVNVDFNSELQLLTVKAYYDLIMIKIEMMTAQLDLHKLVLTEKMAGTNECSRMQLASLKNVDYKEPTISKEKLFLLNILFKFVGRTDAKLGRKTQNIYKFEPFLLGKTNSRLEEIKEKVKENIDDDIKLYDEDYDFDFQFFVCVNSESGVIEKIYEGKDKPSDIPFKTTSKIVKALPCQSEIKQFSNKDLKDLTKKVIDNREDYAKMLDDKKILPP